jgi:hypothetical protein
VIDLIQVQDDLYGILMSAPQLANVNIVEERKFLVNSELEIDAIWQTIRNGCSGDGLLIEIPDIICDSDSVTGPPQQVELSFVSFQNGDAAFIRRDWDDAGDGSLQLAGAGLRGDQCAAHEGFDDAQTNIPGHKGGPPYYFHRGRKCQHHDHDFRGGHLLYARWLFSQ